MRAWQFKLFDNPEDPKPSKVGYVIAPCEGRAIEYITQSMGKAHRLADFKPQVEEVDVQEGLVLWDHF